MPVSPSRVATSPSFIEPPRESARSSACTATARSKVCAYSSAMRMRPAFITGRPSSVMVDRAGAHHLADLGELLALLPHGDGAAGEDARRPRPQPLRQHEAHGRGVVDGRVGVGHGDHGGEAAGRRGPRPACDGLLVLLPGLAQVHVHVDRGRGTPPAPPRPPLPRPRGRPGAPRSPPPRRRAAARPARRPASATGRSLARRGSAPASRFPSPLGGLGFFRRSAGQEVEHRHADGDPVGHLLQDHASADRRPRRCRSPRPGSWAPGGGSARRAGPAPGARCSPRRRGCTRAARG